MWALRRAATPGLVNINLGLPNVNSTSLRFLSRESSRNRELVLQLHLWFSEVVNVVLCLLLRGFHLRSYGGQNSWVTIFLWIRDCTWDAIELRDLKAWRILLWVLSRHVATRSNLKAECRLSSFVHQDLGLIIAVWPRTENNLWSIDRLHLIIEKTHTCLPWEMATNLSSICWFYFCIAVHLSIQDLFRFSSNLPNSRNSFDFILILWTVSIKSSSIIPALVVVFFFFFADLISISFCWCFS